MLALPIVLALVADPLGLLFTPVELDVMPLSQAWSLNGRLVRTTFTVSTEPDYADGVVIVGTGHDDVERTAYLPETVKAARGQDITAVGVLRVRQHPPAVVNGQFVPAWVEVRVAGTGDGRGG
jgi:hypothetical protein